MRILDADDNEVPRGTVGEICSYGGHVMLGYWNKPEETAAAIRDGWMHSGDGGYMDDDGFVFVVDRIKDMIVTGGENVYSAEVEQAVALHPAVAACAVIGIPDDAEPARLWRYHKPKGCVTTHRDPEGRPTVFEKLPQELPRVISIGRLDFNTEGLLLLTNDGELARHLELPATGWMRRYRVRAFGTVTQPQLDALKDGIEVDGVRYGPIEATLDQVQGSNVWLTIGLREGKNREVRNILTSLELDREPADPHLVRTVSAVRSRRRPGRKRQTARAR